MVSQALRGFKTSTILVCMILNGKGCLTGCDLHGYSLTSALFNMSIQYSCCLKIKHFCSISSVFFISFVVSVYYSLAVAEKKRTTSSVSRLVEGLLDVKHFF